MTARREVKSVSFADTDYERGLLEYASKPEHGAFSGYIKRLIERDRAGIALQAVQPASVVAAKAPVRSQEDRSAVMDML
ncbi:hypothetical protein [Sporosarcina phage Lietuvens]|nr:hypothetical protein [Sporosarcina phage Lietuvens]